MSNETQFVDGIRLYAPHEKAPDYVLANGPVDRDALVTWLQKQPPQFRVVIRRAKSGNPYMAVDDWKPNGKPEGSQAKPRQQAKEPAGDASGGFDDDIPFRQLGKRCHWVA